METTPTAIIEPNPYIIDLQKLGKTAFFILLTGILLSLVIKIILDLRKYHYKD